jgi:hypothetical protein
LRNTIERVTLLEDGTELKGSHLDFLQPARHHRRNVIQTPSTPETEHKEQDGIFKLPPKGLHSMT